MRQKLPHQNRGVCLGGEESVEGGASTPEFSLVRVWDVGTR